MTNEEIRKIATYLAQEWYKEHYGGYHWATADEIVEDFLLWLLGQKEEGKYCSEGVG